MKTKNKIQSKSYDSRKLFTVVHLTVTFIQSDVNYIQCIHFVFLASPFATVCATLLQLQHFTYIEAKSEPKDVAHLRWHRRWQLQCFASIHLANLRSLPNKTDKLLLLSQTNKGFSNSAALCFTETWLNDTIPDSSLNLSCGGGMYFYINERLCIDVTVLKKMCCSDLEMLFINCKSFYLPWEICSFILMSVYIPPHVRSAVQKLTDQITETEQKHPNSVLIIIGDFNKANLSRELPKYRQHFTCPTRDSNILDHC